MPFHEFYIRPLASGGSDFNSGTTSADAGGSNSAAFAATNGGFDGTSIFTPNVADGVITNNFVAVDMYASLFNDSDAQTRCIAKVTAVGSGAGGAITVSTTVKYGSVPGAGGTAKGCRVGGSLASLTVTNANTPFVAGTAPQATQINIKAGSYANPSSRSFGMAGTTLFPLTWRGYRDVPGDQDDIRELGDLPVKGVDIPDFTGTTATFTASGAWQIFKNLSFTGAPAAPLFMLNGANGQLIDCLFENTANNRAVQISTSNAYLARSWLKAPTGAASTLYILTNHNHRVEGCIIVGGTVGMMAAVTVYIKNCIFRGHSGDGFQTNGAGTAFLIDECTFRGDGALSGHGINMTVVPTGIANISNSLFTNYLGSGKFAIKNGSGTDTGLVRLLANAFYNNQGHISGITENLTILDNGELASDPLPNSGAGDFGIDEVAWNIGQPGIFMNTPTFRGYRSVGAVQPEVTSGGGGILLNPGMSGGL